MKNFRIFGLIAAICILLPAFVSCDNDDDEIKNVNAIVGTYSGSLKWQVMTSEGVFPESYDIKITPDREKDEVAVTVPQCTFTIPGTDRQHTIPALTITDVEVRESGNVYSIHEDDFDIIVGETHYLGNISGRIAGKDAVINYTLQPGTMPMNINFTFTGTLK